MTRKLRPEERPDRYALRMIPGLKQRAEKLATANHRSLNRQLNLLMMDSLARKENEEVV